MAKSLVIWFIRVRWKSTKWRCRRGIGEYDVIFMLFLEEIRLHYGYKGSHIICLTYATDWWAVIGPVIHGESKSQATRESEQLGPCGSTSLASCQHVGQFFVRVWAKFKQNIVVLCICRHDMVAIMMSNPGVSNKLDVDPLSNSDSQKGPIISFRAEGWSLSSDLRGECF